MLAFLSPVGRAPGPGAPEPPRGTAIGIVLAIILTIMGMVLPWVRHVPMPAMSNSGPSITAR